VAGAGGAGRRSPLIAFVATAGSIPTGWTRYTAADGRFIVGAGSSGLLHQPGGPSGFAENSNVGASDWEHAHGIGNLSVSVSTISVTGSATGGPSDQTGTSSNINGLASTGGVNLNTTGHTHSLNGVSFAVSASGSGSGSTTPTTTAGTTWVPPARALVAVIKS
jgi:hypothetical protein